MTTTASTAPAVAPPNLPVMLHHYIDGEHVPSEGGRTFTTADPVTNQPYAAVAAGGPQDVDIAVAAVRRAFDNGWRDLPAAERARVLRRIADAVEIRDERIAELETWDTGLPITQARGQAKRAAQNFRFFADVIVTLHEDVYRVGRSQLNYVLRKPLGVAGLITPWNTPFMLETWKLAPSLASGCAVVLKPAEWTPLSASLLPEIMAEVGVPAGVFNLVHGIGEEAGAALVAHPDVPVISFTGETTTGQVIARSTADHLKRVSMELGGKSPALVFADADLDRALDAVIFSVFSLNGERCTAGSRVLVERSVYADFVAAMAERANNIRVGSPSDPATQLGALVHPEHYERVRDYVDIGCAEGARLVAGGARPGHLAEGNYLGATVFADVRPDMRVFQEEIFGPVVGVTPFDSEDEAVELANATRYGLAAYLWTNDLDRAHRLADRVEAGMTWINSHNVRDLRTPFGGVKASGVGREGGTASIDAYTDTMVVHLATADPAIPRFGLPA